MKHSSHPRIRDNNKIQITIYEKYYEFYKKKTTAIDTPTRLFYSWFEKTL